MPYNRLLHAPSFYCVSDANSNNWCPSFWTSGEYNVMVMGREWPPVAGCVEKRAGQFNILLKAPGDGGEGYCRSKGTHITVLQIRRVDC